MKANQSTKVFMQALLILGLGIFSSNVSAQTTKTWDGGAGNSNWGDQNNWNNNTLPSNTDDVVLVNNQSVTVNITDAVCKSLKLSPNSSSGNPATLTFATSSQLTVSGKVTLGGSADDFKGSLVMTSGGTLVCTGFLLGNSATQSTFTRGAGTIKLTSTNTLPSSVFTTFNNLIITGGTTTLSRNITIYSNLEIASGTLDLATYTANRSASGGTITVAGTLKIGGTNTFPSNYTTKTLSSGTVEYSGTAQTIPVLSYNILTFSGSGAKTFGSGALNIPGTFTIGSGVTTYVPDGVRYDVGNLKLISSMQPAGVYGGTAAPTSYTVGSSSKTVTKNSTYFGTTYTGVVVANAAALPVTLTNFSAKAGLNNTVNLTWATSTEIVNKGFRIERQSAIGNGKFENIGFVASKATEGGNSAVPLFYSFADIAPASNATNYYRLAQVDLDGKTTYSDVKLVRIGGETVTMVYPNPNNGAVNISRSANTNKMNIQILDMSGRMIQQYSNVTDANFRLNINKAGMYNIKMTYPQTGEQTIQRIVVQK